MYMIPRMLSILYILMVCFTVQGVIIENRDGQKDLENGTHYKEYTCGSTVDDKIFFFVNPLYPDSLPNETLDCHLVISHDCSESTCQIRLDFEEFEISPPVHGDCSKDRFEIDSESPTPILCGYNSKHHLYADVQSRKKTQLRFIIKPLASPKLVIESNGVKSFKSEENSNKRFKILVTQISCGCAKTFNETSSLIKFNNPHLAPIGCTQYFKNLHTGYIKTFNYGGTIRNYEPCFNSSDPICGERVPTGYLNNLDYSICIELPKDHCGLTFTSSSFDVGILPTGRRSIIEKQCEKDYIYIPQGMHPEDFKSSFPASRFCGPFLGIKELKSPIVTYSKPFVIHFHSDGFEERFESTQVGFLIKFNSIPCYLSRFEVGSFV